MSEYLTIHPEACDDMKRMAWYRNHQHQKWHLPDLGEWHKEAVLAAARDRAGMPVRVARSQRGIKLIPNCIIHTGDDKALLKRVADTIVATHNRLLDLIQEGCPCEIEYEMRGSSDPDDCLICSTGDRRR